jgi:hypothetical protein
MKCVIMSLNNAPELVLFDFSNDQAAGRFGKARFFGPAAATICTSRERFLQQKCSLALLWPITVSTLVLMDRFLQGKARGMGGVR